MSFIALCMTISSMAATKKSIDFVVGVDGDFKAALAKAKSAPGTEDTPFVIFFPNGTYNIGTLTGDSNQMTSFDHSNLSIVGESNSGTIIYNTAKNEGISITATLAPSGKNLYFQDLTLENRAYNNPSADANRFVVVMQKGDKLIYKNVSLKSTQDTYYTNSSGRTDFDGGHIEGTVDFICGNGDVFFQGVHLTQTRQKGYITAAKTSTTWGYVFNEATIDATNGAQGTYYLGRSWGNAKTVFLNTKMNAEPTAAGWGDPMNSVPQVFAEYNSKNGNGGNINLGYRRSEYSCSKDGSYAKLNPVLSQSDANKYTIQNVLGGTDNWKPSEFTKQIPAIKIEQSGALIQWQEDASARAYAIFKNGKYFANTTSNNYPATLLSAGDKITIRGVNSKGGLGTASNEISVASTANLTFYGISIEQTAGGFVSSNPTGDSLPEGIQVTFTATPKLGWKLAEWQKDANGSEQTFEIASFEKPTEVSAIFLPIDELQYEAESGDLTNAATESSNVGFSGNAYINYAANGSSICEIPIHLSKKGTYSLEMIYANGSGNARSLSVKTNKLEKEIVFDATGNWTSWDKKQLEIELDSGYTSIAFSTVGANDGPNLDKIVLTPIKVEEPKEDSKTSVKVFVSKQQVSSVIIYDMQGNKIRETKNIQDTQNLPHGIYLVKLKGKTNLNKVIRVR